MLIIVKDIIYDVFILLHLAFLFNGCFTLDESCGLVGCEALLNVLTTLHI